MGLGVRGGWGGGVAASPAASCPRDSKEQKRKPSAAPAPCRPSAASPGCSPPPSHPAASRWYPVAIATCPASCASACGGGWMGGPAACWWDGGQQCGWNRVLAPCHPTAGPEGQPQRPRSCFALGRMARDGGARLQSTSALTPAQCSGQGGDRQGPLWGRLTSALRPAAG